MNAALVTWSTSAFHKIHHINGAQTWNSGFVSKDAEVIALCLCQTALDLVEINFFQRPVGYASMVKMLCRNWGSRRFDTVYPLMKMSMPLDFKSLLALGCLKEMQGRSQEQIEPRGANSINI